MPTRKILFIELAKVILPTNWLVRALALSTSQVAAWKNNNKPLPQRAEEALETYLFHPGHDAQKDISAKDMKDGKPHYYDEECNCILDGIENSGSYCGRTFHMRLPFQWINFLHSLEMTS